MYKIVMSASAVFICAFVADICFPPDMSKIHDTSSLLLSDDGRILFATLSKDEKWRFYTKSSDVSEIYLRLLMNYEDKNFFRHAGVNPFSIMRASVQLISNMKVISGASTITMQVAKLLEKRPRNIISKIIECFRAIQLERRFSKDEILSMYLSLAPFGGNKEGIIAASWLYFGKKPDSLTLEEASFLVGIPKSPYRLSPDKRYDAVVARQRNLLSKFLSEKIITRSEHDFALKNPPEAITFRIPKHASHLLYYLRKNHPSEHTFKTYIKYDLQAVCEKLLQRNLMRRAKEMAAATIIVDSRTGNIVTYIGSAFPMSKSRKGFIDMAQAVRSPGSALKPFIYAIAFDEKLIHPKTIIADKKTEFSCGYSPKNFYPKFYGDISIEESLRSSLNTPSVSLLEAIGPSTLVTKIEALDATLHYKKGDDHSLPIALGGIGISLFDLTFLYTVFPRYGSSPSKRILQNDPSKEFLFCKKESAAYINIILKNAVQPGENYHPEITNSDTTPYKTGTSYGNRDAVTIGYTKNYVIGVWTGRCDGSPVTGMSGYKSAAPLFASIVTSLNDETFVCDDIHEYASINSTLSRPLRKFHSLSQKTHEKQIHILSPTNNSCLFFGQNREISIKIEKGVPPFHIFIDGKMHISKDRVYRVLISLDGWHAIYIADSVNNFDSVKFNIKSSCD